MSILHCDEPPVAGVNDVLAAERNWLGRYFRVNVRQDPCNRQIEIVNLPGCFGIVGVMSCIGMTEDARKDPDNPSRRLIRTSFPFRALSRSRASRWRASEYV